ncbi:type II RES/Xre toxin-antitoxin system antitoxin [Geothermobacter hydrogeniphilus]|uniref:Antitoxin Xre/MbcA/ParS-like toxin-binding domain-containing protein n=1 Tax=Geothermobacter hydrogeniphilus TaxID=1969733 RepID=A0A1X0Y5H9_9BACT|nr:antitoxin Xre/MbcA/ParS toxin-binding domain-containing protein [Geothermobacter hydrogeniphilus]ORJ60294.1 hypothetical protein B5V00_08565 [Geothermobacter hydrogeniphilus]
MAEDPAEIPGMKRLEKGWPELVASSRKGLSGKTLGYLASALQIPLAELAELLSISDRDLQRQKANKLLDKSLSVRVLQLADVISRAEDVFSDQSRARTWLKRPCPALRGQTPLNLLDTPFGIRAVLDELGRIEHGVYS